MPYLAHIPDFIDLSDGITGDNDLSLPDRRSTPIAPQQQFRGQTPPSSDNYHGIEVPEQEHSNVAQEIDIDSDGYDESSSVATDPEHRTRLPDQGTDTTPSDNLSSQTSETHSCEEKDPITREDFVKLLNDSEPASTLSLLYPPSLWRHSNNVDPDIQDKDLIKIFPLPSLDQDWTEVEINEFCIYNGIDHGKYPGQYESLHTVISKENIRMYLLDGIVRSDGHTFKLIGVKIAGVYTGGSNLSNHSCENQFWVQTQHTAKFDGWLRLKTPTAAYASIWKDFVWLANFAKYCVDYLVLSEQEEHPVTLQDFRSDFVARLMKHHCNDMLNSVQNWLCGIDNAPDLRRHLVQYVEYIYKVCSKKSLSKGFANHPVWNEIGRLESKTRLSDTQTLVTRNTASTFITAFPEWGPAKWNLLQSADCEANVESQRQERMKILKLPDKFARKQSDDFRIEDDERVSKVEHILYKAGTENRSVSCPPEQLVNKLVVVRQIQKEELYFDFAYVNRLAPNQKCVRIIWLTVPSRTICAMPNTGKTLHKLKAHYPIGNELFFSDDCNCFSVGVEDIVGVYDIKILPDTEQSTCDLFATTMYLEQEECFIQMTKEWLNHTCSEFCSRPQSPGAKRLGTPRRSPGVGNSNDDSCRKPLHEEQLNNLSLFSGCGLFDRALEASGTILTTFSIDSNAYAMRSAQANSPMNTKWGASRFVVASVNSELRKIMEGHRVYPKPGCLSAGSPCPGFSFANNQRNEKRGQLECSLLASTMAWIEITLPAYVVIENVPTMDFGSPSACSQAISFLVALGYQVRKARLKAVEYGGSTIRERLFIIAAAPAFRLPDQPKPTHGESDPLLPYVTIEDETADLGVIHNDTLVHIPAPYHVPISRLLANLTNSGVNFRNILQRIPVSPPGEGLLSSQHLLTPAQLEWFQGLHPMVRDKGSKAAKRVQAKGFFRTIMTKSTWLCAITGELVHYNQDRLLSLEEVARAQGVPRDFVLIGSADQKLKQVGNAVPWCLREAIGREIAKAYRQSNPLPAATSVDEDVVLNQEVNGTEDEDIFLSTKEDFETASQQRNLDLSGSEEQIIESRKGQTWYQSINKDDEGNDATEEPTRKRAKLESLSEDNKGMTPVENSSDED